MPAPSINISEDSLTANEITMQQRRFNAQNAHQALVAQGLVKSGTIAPGLGKQGIPPELERTYHLGIIPGANSKDGMVRMREIRAN